MNNNINFEKEYPWYDDRVYKLDAEKEEDDWVEIDIEAALLYPDNSQSYDTPKKIYEYLDQHVWKQEEAKRAASIIAYNCFECGLKSNAMFIGPTGCGKTHIWRCLQAIFRDRIMIVDGSNLTQDGWKGEKKWSSLLSSPIFRTGEKTILVVDEADKMLAPKYSHSENISHSVQAEGLAMMEGTQVDVKEGSTTYAIDTSKISFVFCGAFSAKAQDMAEKESGNRIGFGAAPKEVKAYECHLEAADLIEFGVMPEFVGRIQRIVHLEPMTAEDYYLMTDNSCETLKRISTQYRADIRLSPETRHKLAEEAYNSGLGIRGMENRIREMMDEALFEDCDRRRFEF